MERVQCVLLALVLLCVCYSIDGFPDFIENNGLKITRDSNVCRYPKTRIVNVTTPVRRQITRTVMKTCYKTIKIPWEKNPIPFIVSYKCPVKTLKMFVTINETITRTSHGYSLKCCLHWKKKKPSDTDCKTRVPDFIEYNGLNIKGDNVCRYPKTRIVNVTTPVRRQITIMKTCYRKLYIPWIQHSLKQSYKCPDKTKKMIVINETMTRTSHGYSLKCCLHWKKITPSDTDCKTRFLGFIEYNGLNIKGKNVCRYPTTKIVNVTTPVRRQITRTIMKTCFKKVTLPWQKNSIPLNVSYKCLGKIIKLYVTINETMTRTSHGYSLKCCLHWKKKKPSDTECKTRNDI